MCTPLKKCVVIARYMFPIATRWGLDNKNMSFKITKSSFEVISLVAATTNSFVISVED
jgi:hypothetical protein